MTYKTFQNVQDNPRVRDGIKAILAPGDTQVWYSRDYVGDIFLTAAERFNPDSPTSTHILLTNVVGYNEKQLAKALQTRKMNIPPLETYRESLYIALQGESWSPNGEANDFLYSVGATHTSLSCGDVLVIEGIAYVCMANGWEGLKMPS